MKKSGESPSDPKSPAPEDDPAQSKRFRDLAEKLGLPDSPGPLDEVMDSIREALPEVPPDRKKPAI